MSRPPHPSRRPDRRQLDTIRTGAHQDADTICDAHPHLTHQAKTMGAGYPASSGVDSSGGNAGITVPNEYGEDEFVAATGVERLALEKRPDPASLANEWLIEFDEWVAFGKRLANRARSLLPVDTTTHKALVDKDRELGECPSCKTPVYKGGARYLDDKPYHATSCYYRAWRSRQQAS